MVEDSAELSDAFGTMLKHSGFDVSVANSLAEARSLSGHIDAMLLDLTLPDGDGLGYMRELKMRGRVPVATIALTGREESGLRDRCLRAGCSDLMVKPVALSTIVSRLNELLAAEPEEDQA